MSRPKVYDEPRVATAIRLPSSLHGELQNAATERDVSVNFLVTRAVSAYLAQLPPADADLPPAEGASRDGARQTRASRDGARQDEARPA